MNAKFAKQIGFPTNKDFEMVGGSGKTCTSTWYPNDHDPIGSQLKNTASLAYFAINIWKMSYFH